MIQQLLIRRFMGSNRDNIDWKAIALELMNGSSASPYPVCVIPEGVTYIRPYAFRQCYFSSIQFPNSLRTISQQAFEYLHGCAVIELGENITTIGNWAFQSMHNVQRLIIHTVTPPSGYGTINGSYPIYVPDEPVEAYKTATGWSNIANRIFPISDMPTT